MEEVDDVGQGPHRRRRRQHRQRGQQHEPAAGLERQDDDLALAQQVCRDEVGRHLGAVGSWFSGRAHQPAGPL